MSVLLQLLLGTCNRARELCYERMTMAFAPLVGVYRDQRGHFHMLFNANSGHSNCRAGIPCGGHAWSMDGLSWSLPYWPAFGTITHYQDNTSAHWDYVERPQVSQEPNGTPLAFFAGHGYSDIHTLAYMFCQAGDKDCVTTVQ